MSGGEAVRLVSGYAELIFQEGGFADPDRACHRLRVRDGRTVDQRGRALDHDVLSRIEAERGRALAAIAAYREAKSLNPRFSLFQQ